MNVLGNRKKIIKALENVQVNICEYSNSIYDFCDCKFGIDEQKNRVGEKSGCPEVKSAIMVIGLMTDREFESVIKRIKKHGHRTI